MVIAINGSSAHRETRLLLGLPVIETKASEIAGAPFRLQEVIEDGGRKV
jgi:hypothetical protein